MKEYSWDEKLAPEGKNRSQEEFEKYLDFRVSTFLQREIMESSVLRNMLTEISEKTIKNLFLGFSAGGVIVVGLCVFIVTNLNSSVRGLESAVSALNATFSTLSYAINQQEKRFDSIERKLEGAR